MLGDRKIKDEMNGTFNEKELRDATLIHNKIVKQRTN